MSKLALCVRVRACALCARVRVRAHIHNILRIKKNCKHNINCVTCTRVYKMKHFTPFYTGYRLDLVVESKRGRRRLHSFDLDTLHEACSLAEAFASYPAESWHIVSLIINYFKNGQKQTLQHRH